ncbi:AIPR family protein [Lacihabitans lacunae]|uniref:AIPR family protein n=1 Tax=Lacihabitans lacunae TaxID=1028214 RepID=A0ABV7Z206_9BACT
MTKEEFETRLFKEVDFLKDNGKEKAINFLIWFLVNYFRIEEELAVDLVCDHKNDKGIDGIYVDKQSKEVILLQSKLREKFNKSDGDGELRKLVGSGKWFKAENLDKLEQSRAAKELKSLVSELKVFDLLNEGYTLKLLFVTTGYFDFSAKDYIKVTPEVEYWDNNRLYSNFTYNGTEELVNEEFILEATDKIIENKYTTENSAFTLALKASELLKLNGIVDRSLFSKNVRYGLGKTNVNRSIAKTIKDKTKHNKFILFHNGITVVCHKAEKLMNEKLKITNYSVVNGCQSTLTLYENREYISDDLQVMVKVVATGENTKLSDEITYFANNQNPINPSDLKSREKFQLDLQKQFQHEYNSTVHYKIKRGEKVNDGAVVIENTFAAQLIHSFSLESPFNSHLKTSTFSKQYDKIFTRHTDIHLIYFLNETFDLIQNNLDKINEPIVRSYQPTKFFILFVLKRIINESGINEEFNESTQKFLSKYSSKRKAGFEKLIQIIMIQLNSDLENLKDEDEYIDYKNILRNSTEGKKLANSIIKGYKILLVHNPENKLEELLK